MEQVTANLTQQSVDMFASTSSASLQSVDMFGVRMDNLTPERASSTPSTTIPTLRPPKIECYLFNYM